MTILTMLRNLSTREEREEMLAEITEHAADWSLGLRKELAWDGLCRTVDEWEHDLFNHGVSARVGVPR
jgi:hypothetical protein